jgi:hypothetical protein
MPILRAAALLLAAALLHTTGAGAQTNRPAPALDTNTGLATFADEDAVEHFQIGVAPRFYLSPRVSVGPEFVYMVGPGEDRDIFFTGNVWFDIAEADATGVKRVTPYLVAGVGVMAHRDFLFNEGVTWFHKEVGFSGGIGARIALNDRWYVAPEARLGSELHARLTAVAGYRFAR